MTPSSHIGTFKLAKQLGGRGLYAAVAVEVLCEDSASATEIVWEEEALRSCDIAVFRLGAQRGISMALDAFHGPVRRVQVQKVSVALVDSTADCVAFAACFAVWDALQVCGLYPPEIRDGKIIFPENP